jgi:hypothetical protein
MAKATVKQVPEKEIPTEVLATSIVSISEGIKKLRAGRLTDRALWLLIQDAAPSVGGKFGNAKLSMKEIRAVFEGIESLERVFIKKKPADR